MANQDRSALKSFFVKNAIPTEQNFADLLDSVVVLDADGVSGDGIFKAGGEPLSFAATSAPERPVLQFYEAYPTSGQTPSWIFGLTAGGASALDIRDGAGTSRMTVTSTGNVGIGATSPAHKLDVQGTGSFSSTLRVPYLELVDGEDVNGYINAAVPEMSIGGSTSIGTVYVRDTNGVAGVTLNGGGSVVVAGSPAGGTLTVQNAAGGSSILLFGEGAQATFGTSGAGGRVGSIRAYAGTTTSFGIELIGNGIATIGTTGAPGKVQVRNTSNVIAISLTGGTGTFGASGQSGLVSVNNSSASDTVRLDGATGTVYAGGSGQAGTINVTNSSEVAEISLDGSTATAEVGGGSSSGTLYVTNSGGSRGIELRGSTASAYIGGNNLNGEVYVRNSSSVLATQLTTSTTNAYGYFGTSGVTGNVYIRNSSNHSTILLYGSNGEVACDQVDCEGSIYYTGGLYNSSDERGKRNIQGIQSSLATLSRLRGVTFERADGRGDGGQRLGVIAQEIQREYPALVRRRGRRLDPTDEEGNPLEDGPRRAPPESPDADLYVDYIGLIPILIESVKELNAEVETLRNRVGGGGSGSGGGSTQPSRPSGPPTPPLTGGSNPIGEDPGPESL